MQEAQIPNITIGETKGSYWIWDTDVLGAGVDAYSGTKCLFALYRFDQGRVDDWAITPALSGQAQEIVFYARSYDASYPEKIELYYSTGSTDIDDFILIENAGGKVPGTWTPFIASVPEGARRFAIRSCAKDAFMLLVDDFTFIPEKAYEGVEIEGYTIYRNGEKLADTVSCEYLDTTVEAGKEYAYVVAVNYNAGVSPLSNTFIFTGSGISGVSGSAAVVEVSEGTILIRNAGGLPVAVNTVGGMTVYSATGSELTEIRVAKGVYIVTVGNAIHKVAVK